MRISTKLMTPLLYLAVASGCKTASSGATLKDAAVSDDEGDSDADDDRPRQLYRFDPWIKTVHASLEGKPGATAEQIATAIVDGPTRVSAYNLQGLARLYEKEDKMFADMRDDFKKMEDAIGLWDKWNNVLTKANTTHAAPDVVKKLQAKRDLAAKAIVAFLKKEKWFRADGGETELAKIERQLADYKWKKYKKDRAMVLGKFDDELKEIKATKYQFKHLEQGNGLHELRRDIKWVVIEMRVLNGLVVFDDAPTSCPISDYADLINQPIATSKYSQLPPSTTEKNVCKIDQCLFLGLVDLVEGIGLIKDDVEARLNTNTDDEESDKVPADVQEKVGAIYKHMVDTDLIDAVHDEIKKCY